MARPGARGLGPGLSLKYSNCVAGWAGPEHTFSGPGPGLIIQFAGRARAGSAQLLRARAGPGPQIIFAAGPGPKFQPRAGPYSLPSRVYLSLCSVAICTATQDNIDKRSSTRTVSQQHETSINDATVDPAVAAALATQQQTFQTIIDAQLKTFQAWERWQFVFVDGSVMQSGCLWEGWSWERCEFGSWDELWQIF